VPPRSRALECPRAQRHIGRRRTAVPTRRGGPATAGPCTVPRARGCDTGGPQASATCRALTHRPGTAIRPLDHPMPRTYAEGELSCPHLNSRGSLSREALLPYTLAAYKTPPPSFSHARTSSAAAAIGGCTMSSPSACSSSHLIPQTPPLGPVGARAVAHSPALPRSSTDFNPQRPLQPDTAARRRG
jgi:hypothetical protein